MMKMTDITILFEDKDILVCVKPAGVPSQSDKTGDYDMVSRLKNYLFQKNPKGGEPYIGLIHRLDRPVGGVMVFAKTKNAARILSESVRKREFSKYYLALATYDGSREIGKEKLLLSDYLVKENSAGGNFSKIADAQNKEAKKAELFYRIKASADGLSLVEVELLTGRHHQIRVQLAKHLGGIWGDTKYNPLFQDKKGFYKMGLYAYHLEFMHPVSRKKVEFTSLPTDEPFDKNMLFQV